MLHTRIKARNFRIRNFFVLPIQQLTLYKNPIFCEILGNLQKLIL